MSGNWSNHRIKGELAMRGHTLASASRAAGLHRSAGSIALKQHWPKAEQAIAAVIGVTPAEIWPDRYPAADPSSTGETQ